MRQVIETAEAVVGRPIPVKEGARRAGDPAVLVAGSERAKRELGWTPRFPDLKEIVRTAWEWTERIPTGMRPDPFDMFGHRTTCKGAAGAGTGAATAPFSVTALRHDRQVEGRVRFPQVVLRSYSGPRLLLVDEIPLLGIPEEPTGGGPSAPGWALITLLLTMVSAFGVLRMIAGISST